MPALAFCLAMAAAAAALRRGVISRVSYLIEHLLNLIFSTPNLDSHRLA
jgi:hypothetical protein